MRAKLYLKNINKYDLTVFTNLLIDNGYTVTYDKGNNVKTVVEIIKDGEATDEVGSLKKDLDYYKSEVKYWKGQYEGIVSFRNCNNCGIKDDCDYCPKAGERVRINCPFWAGDI